MSVTELPTGKWLAVGVVLVAQAYIARPVGRAGHPRLTNPFRALPALPAPTPSRLSAGQG